MAGLLKYFKRRCDMQKKDAGTLPDPESPLSRDILSLAWPDRFLVTGCLLLAV